MGCPEYSRRSFVGKGALSLMSLLGAARLLSAEADGASQAATVPTVLKPIAPSRLGTTLMHEHVLFGVIPQDLQDRSVEIAVKLLNDAKQAGVDTVVDLTPYRNIHLYHRIALQTQINIIASTGYYLRGKIPSYLQNMTELQMENRMYQEITQGIDGTGIRAGVIKVAADTQPLTAWETMVFRAAARVQKETKVPIATHAVSGARVQFELLTRNGADPKHINFGHIETTSGWQGKTKEQMALELLPIVEGGSYLLFNNFSCPFYTTWTDMVYLLKFYCDKGFSDRILISEDTNWQWEDGKQVFEMQNEHPDAARRTYAYMMTHEVPIMYDSGFSKHNLRTFLVENPRRFFSVA
jgi:phosphotriesterase-related protein